MTKGDIAGLCGVFFFLIWPFSFLITGLILEIGLFMAIAAAPYVIFTIAMLIHYIFYLTKSAVTKEY